MERRRIDPCCVIARVLGQAGLAVGLRRGRCRMALSLYDIARACMCLCEDGKNVYN